jgi:ATP-dependent exoDNAse (exonuclease V) beta subunit
VSPGLHQVGEQRVVWWDPSLLKHIDQGSTRSRLTEFLKEDETKLRSEEGIHAHEEWQRLRANLRQVASKPEWEVVTATAPAFSELLTPSLPEVVVETIDIDFSRPHGKRFGTLVHAVLSIVPLTANRDAIREIARLQGRVLGATDDEIGAAVETVRRALQHQLIKQAVAASANGQCRREVPVALKLDAGVMVEGVIDLAFQEKKPNGPWTVIDYKTDFEVKGRLEEYRNQVSLYALAISRATGLPAHPILLRV